MALFELKHEAIEGDYSVTVTDMKVMGLNMSQIRWLACYYLAASGKGSSFSDIPPGHVVKAEFENIDRASKDRVS
jgi:hypothetical protein